MFKFLMALLLMATSAIADERCIESTIFVRDGVQLSGTLCRAGKDNRIDVLIHGATYTRSYWDFPVKPGLYSYVHRSLEIGRSVFFYDRLGVGKSSKLDSTEVDVAADANALHAVIEQLRRQGFDEINVIGHSFGSVVAVREASVYHDARRLVLTGLIHAPGPGQAVAAMSTYSAFLDPQFVGQGFDAGWRTTIPGARGKIFYYLPTTDQKVLDFDEAHKSLVSLTQLLDALNDQLNLPPATNPSRLIDVPVLALSGQFDTLSCGLVLDCNDETAVAAYEGAFYPGSPSFTAHVVPNTGHDIALHETAETSFDMIMQWLNTH